MTINQRPGVLPLALPRRIGLPYHGLVTAGQLALPGGGIKAHRQPDGGSTVLVAGKSPPGYTPTEAEAALAATKGYNWQSYAYLSGKGKMIGGQEIDDTAKGAKWYQRDTGNWLYNDGKTTWLMNWEGSSNDAGFTLLTISVMRPFGVFGKTIEPPNRVIFQELFALPNADIGQSPEPILYLAYHSQDGSVSAINESTRLLYIAGDLAAFTSLYPWVLMQKTGDFWAAIYLIPYNYIELTLAGEGSLQRGSVGSGITASVVRGSHAFGTDDYDGIKVFTQLRTVTPAGDFKVIGVSAGLAGQTPPERTLRRGTLSGVFPDAVFTCDQHNGQRLEFPYAYGGNDLALMPNVGMEFVDNCYFRMRSGTPEWTALHLQAGGGCVNGISYDIANDAWSTTAGSCYV